MIDSSKHAKSPASALDAGLLHFNKYQARRKAVTAFLLEKSCDIGNATGAIGMHNAFDPNPGHRTEAEWRQLLIELLDSLSAFTGVPFNSTSLFIEDQNGYASAGGCIDIRGTVSRVLQIEACGVLSASVNFGEAAWVLCDLLLFTDGKRLLGPNQCDLVCLRYTAEGWVNHGWTGDEYREWESHTTDTRWAQKREDTIIIS